MNENNSHNAGFAKGALLGAAIGALLGVLYAPDSGKKTRQTIRNKSSEYAEMGMDKLEEGWEDVVNISEDIASEAEKKMRFFLKKLDKLSGTAQREALDKLELLADALDEMESSSKKTVKRVFKNIKS